MKNRPRTSISFSCRWWAVIVLFACTVSNSSGNLSGQAIQWESRLDRASELAKQQNKLVLLHFTADWCHPCQHLETFVFSNAQVQRSLAANVIAVKIDVDEQPNVVKEYGVAGVPFDVALTPAGRIVSKRSSPQVAQAYNDMVQGFSVTIQALAGGENVALNQNLAELKDKIYADNQVVERKPLAPLAPTHTGPQASFESKELKRGSKINNPFAQAPTSASFVLPATDSTEAESNQLVDRTSVQPKRIINDRLFTPELPVKATDRTAIVEVVPHAVSAVPTSVAGKQNKFEEGSPKPELKKSLATQISHDEPKAETAAKSLASKSGFALHGMCPVTLLKEGRWADGNEKWGCVHRKQTYLFVSEECLGEFQRDPDAYSPLLAGFDPVVFNQSGTLVAGLEEHGVFMGKSPNQRVVLFSDAATRAEFQANPKTYIETIRQAMQSSGGSSSTIMR